jgi:hypothetical protein
MIIDEPNSEAAGSQMQVRRKQVAQSVKINNASGFPVELQRVMSTVNTDTIQGIMQETLGSSFTGCRFMSGLGSRGNSFAYLLLHRILLKRNSGKSCVVIELWDTRMSV